MTATDRLRALLDERGVEWETWCPMDGATSTYVEHNGEAWRFDYDEHFDQLVIVPLSGYTPEQAVEATLGRGTCSIVKTWSDSDYDEDWRYRCSGCGCFIPVNERDPETGDVISAANYCPNCGAKVVSS